VLHWELPGQCVLSRNAEGRKGRGNLVVLHHHHSLVLASGVSFCLR
jgi:hypothetical protein